jgi:hypothetical protein
MLNRSRISAVRQIALTIVLSAMAVGLAIEVEAAEKRQQSYVKTNFRSGYKTAVPIGDIANHSLDEELSTADIKYANPDFKTRDEWAFVHRDSIDGTGTETGYYVDTHEDGSRTYGTFKGTVRTVTKPDGTWEVTTEGTYEYVGGSGKYKNIKGHGKYKGHFSSQNPTGIEEGQETIEY